MRISRCTQRLVVFLYVEITPITNSPLGHQFLYNQGILHRDVSAGNMLLSIDPNANDDNAGFITDIEYALVADEVIVLPVEPVRGPDGRMTLPTTRTLTKFRPVKHGAAMMVSF